MSAPPPVIDHYDWSGGREAMLRFGPSEGPVVVAALPLFEEANRTRAFVVTILRRLTTLGIGSALPDLPGQGESTLKTECVSLGMLQQAFASAANTCRARGHPYALAIRSGALLDQTAAVYGRWHLSPQTGGELVRELGRIAGHGTDPDWWCRSETVEIAGNLVSTELLSETMTAKPDESPLGTPLRIARLDGDARPGDLKVPGAALWRRIEPHNDSALAELLADDIAAWVRTCAG